MNYNENQCDKNLDYFYRAPVPSTRLYYRAHHNSWRGTTSQSLNDVSNHYIVTFQLLHNKAGLMQTRRLC